MWIKLKDKSEIHVCDFVVGHGLTETCRWTGKTIKGGKKFFMSFDFNAPRGAFCSASALKAAANAAL
jgi:hypothetical protein